MSYLEALEIMVARTHHEPYRTLCADENPDVETRDAYRSLMVRLATDEPEPSATEALQAYVAQHPCGGCP